jgi:predicted ATPase
MLSSQSFGLDCGRKGVRGVQKRDAIMDAHPQLSSIEIKGYRPFKDFTARFRPLEVIVGANGSGKSSLFEFLRFLRDGLYQDIPPEIVKGSIGQQIFHIPGPEKFSWCVAIRGPGDPPSKPLRYGGELVGPVGRIYLSEEYVRYSGGYMGRPVDMRATKARDIAEGQEIALTRFNQLALGTAFNPAMKTLFGLREYIRGWRFYNSLNIAAEKVRKSVPVEQEPVLHEDGGNLASVLFYLMSEHRSAFDDLQSHLHLAIPGFKGLNVKARGGPGEVMAYWQEDGVDKELSLADLADGILRFLCWAVLCVQPNPPTLVCIDEPDQGLHPKVLPLLAGLFEKATERTQILLATHASYFLMQFDPSRHAVIRKENGEAKFIKPKDSKALEENLKDFGPEEIEIMHRSGELEWLP